MGNALLTRIQWMDGFGTLLNWPVFSLGRSSRGSNARDPTSLMISQTITTVLRRHWNLLSGQKDFKSWPIVARATPYIVTGGQYPWTCLPVRRCCCYTCSCHYWFNHKFGWLNKLKIVKACKRQRKTLVLNPHVICSMWLDLFNALLVASFRFSNSSDYWLDVVK